MIAHIENAFPARLGTRVFGVAAVALGIIGLCRGDFTVIWHPMPEGLYARTELAYACAALFVIAGLGIQNRKTVTFAGFALCGLYVLLSTGWIIRVILLPNLIGTWLGVAEQWSLATGAVTIVCTGRPHPRTLELRCRLAFGICEILFALGHFLSLRETVALTPTWLPPGPTFWALATGAGHGIGGVALLLNVVPVLAARLLALMFTAFGLFVWLPTLVQNPTDVVAWSGNAINLALLGAVLAIGDMLTQANAGRRAAPG